MAIWKTDFGYLIDPLEESKPIAQASTLEKFKRWAFIEYAKIGMPGLKTGTKVYKGTIDYYDDVVEGFNRFSEKLERFLKVIGSVVVLYLFIRFIIPLFKKR